MTSPRVEQEPKLTPRQLECMELVRDGLTSKQIAYKLRISHRTVEAHVAAVIEALQVNNRMAAVTALEDLKRQRDKEQSVGPTQSFMLGDLTFGSYEDLAIRPLPRVSDTPIDMATRRTLPPLGGVKNEVPMKIRARWIAVISATGIMLSCLIFLVIMGVTELAA